MSKYGAVRPEDIQPEALSTGLRLSYDVRLSLTVQPSSVGSEEMGGEGKSRAVPSRRRAPLRETSVPLASATKLPLNFARVQRGTEDAKHSAMRSRKTRIKPMRVGETSEPSLKEPSQKVPSKRVKFRGFSRVYWQAAGSPDTWLELVTAFTHSRTDGLITEHDFTK